MPTPDPTVYAEDWVQAWNAHDIEAVLRHFRDDVVFTSPVAARVLPETELRLSLSRHHLSLRFHTQSPQSLQLVSHHRPSLIAHRRLLAVE